MTTTRAGQTTANGRGRTFTTRIDLPERVRSRVIALLNQQLADTSDLYSQTKQAHWNVKGPEFFQLHELFDQLAESVEGFIDLIAERVTALGGEARGTVRMAAGGSRLAEYPDTLKRGLQHVEVLAERYAQYAAAVRADIDTTAKLGDQGTSDLFIEIVRATDKHLWFLDAHLQTD
ncbi:MAG: DNA starvation/stationary phase protection protein Dps [Dehalococcoidia bacterium]